MARALRQFTGMFLIRKYLCAAVLATEISSGCGTYADLTRSADVQRSGILGQQLRTAQDLDLLKDKPSRTLRLVTKDYPTWPRNRRIGVVPAGTSLRVNQVKEVTELVAILVVLPEYYSWKCTFARIEEGPFVGKEVAIYGMLSHDNTATLGSVFFVTTKSPSSVDERVK